MQHDQIRRGTDAPDGGGGVCACARRINSVRVQFPALHGKLNLTSREWGEGGEGGKEGSFSRDDRRSPNPPKLHGLFHPLSLSLSLASSFRWYMYTCTCARIHEILSPDESGVRGGAGRSRRGARGGRRVGLLHVHHRSYR